MSGWHEFNLRGRGDDAFPGKTVGDREALLVVVQAYEH